MTEESGQTPLYRGASALFTRNILFLIAIAAATTALEYAAGPTPSLIVTGVEMLIWFWLSTWVAYSGHVSLMREDRLNLRSLWSRTTQPNLAFWTISGAGGIILLCLYAISFGLAGSTDLSWMARPGLLVLFLAVPLAAYSILLAGFGLTFPVAALEGKLRVRRSWREGRPIRVRLWLDLLRGMFVCSLTMWGLVWFGNRLGLPIEAWTMTELFSPLGGIMSFAIALLGYWVSYLGIVALCNAYKATQARHDPSHIFL